MIRPASRLIARSSAVRILARAVPARRFLSTGPRSQKSRSWKSLVGRVGILGAILYFYNTTELFAKEPRLHQIPETNEETKPLPTIEALTRERQQRKAELVGEQKDEGSAQETAGAGAVQDAEEEAGQLGAFNPKTGEINWDCPCLGGMATGPCGEQFKAAFSCFVYSDEEPKGMDCVDKFKDMQNCFREYPEVYGDELAGDEDDDVTGDDDLAALAEPQESAPSQDAAASRPEADHRSQTEQSQAATEQSQTATEQRKNKQEARSGSDEVTLDEGHDYRGRE